MAWSFTDLRYGWKIATGIALASTTIYVANNTRWRVNQADVIELALGVDERIMALQTGTNAFGAPVYPVARPSFVRNWITNNYETQVVGGVTSVVAVAYTNTFTNTIGYRTDHAMMVELDAKLKEIVPYYKDPITYQPLTFTGLLASLNIGDGTNFTRTPAIGTNAATYGEYPMRIYVQDLQERYKVLNALQWASNSYMWCSNQTIYVWLQSPPVPGLTPRWRGTFRDITWTSFRYDWDWIYMTDRAAYLWGSGSVGTNSEEAPRSYTIASHLYPAEGYPIVGMLTISSCESIYEIGPFATNTEHNVLVEARSITAPRHYEGWNGTSEWTSVGAVGDQNEWVSIISATNSTSVWHYSETFGDTALPGWCEEPLTNGWSNSKGNIHEVKYSAWFGDPSRWVLNGTALTNAAFGTNSQFY